MAVQQTSGGTAKEKQFVDTIGGFTGVGGENHTVISTFLPLTVKIETQPLNGNTFIRTKLNDLIITAGYAPVKCFQFYRITEIEIWLHDIDFGANWEMESQIWNVFMAPWKINPYIQSGVFANINARYIPGCVWKNFVAPTVNGAQDKGTPHSSGNNQLINIKISDPVFELETYNSDATLSQGKQMNHTFLPTFSNLGINETVWQAALVSYYRVSGDHPPPNPMFMIYMTKVTFEFKGLRCLLTTALDLYLPDEQEEAQKNYINTTPDVPRRKRAYPAEERDPRRSLGNDAKNRRPNRTVNELHH